MITTMDFVEISKDLKLPELQKNIRLCRAAIRYVATLVESYDGLTYTCLKAGMDDTQYARWSTFWESHQAYLEQQLEKLTEQQYKLLKKSPKKGRRI